MLTAGVLLTGIFTAGGIFAAVNCRRTIRRIQKIQSIDMKIYSGAETYYIKKYNNDTNSYIKVKFIDIGESDIESIYPGGILTRDVDKVVLPRFNEFYIYSTNRRSFAAVRHRTLIIHVAEVWFMSAIFLLLFAMLLGCGEIINVYFKE